MPALSKKELRQLVAISCTDEVLNQLLELLAGVPKYSKVYNAINLLSNQWQELDIHLRLNRLSFKESSTEKARINAAVLAYLDELPDEIAPPSSTAPVAASFLALEPKQPGAKKEAKANPADDVSWKIACKNNTISAYRGYLDKWENGLHDAEAEQKIEELSNDQDLWDYLNDHSNPQLFESNLLDYLEIYPNGIHAIEALARIAAFEGTRAANAQVEKEFADKQHQVEEVPIATAKPNEVRFYKKDKKYKNGQSIFDMPDGPEMVFVEGGTFQMGSNEGDSEKPIHPVTVPTFWIGKYPITFDEYDVFCNDTGNAKPKDEGWGRGLRPVINVDWNKAQAYCKWLSEKTGEQYRLPSEAEWEFAARGGVSSKMTRFSGSEILDEVGWFTENSGGKTHPVGEKKANELGLHDMSGNVEEWCQDGDNSDYNGAPNDGSAWAAASWMAGTILRGGSWSSFLQGVRMFSIFTFCHVTFRSIAFRFHESNYLGFRVARDQ